MGKRTLEKPIIAYYLKETTQTKLTLHFYIRTSSIKSLMNHYPIIKQTLHKKPFKIIKITK